MESKAVFTLSPPHYIDYHFSFSLNDNWTPGALGDFMEQSWCNYMNGLTDPAIYFVSGGRWVREYSTTHGYKAMYYPSALPIEEREKRPVADYERRGLPVPFHWPMSETTFDLPLYFGRVHGMMYLAMFDQYKDWRFFMSPTGGGGNALGPGYHNPAWDWSWMIRSPAVGRTYECNIRLVYKKFTGTQDALEEYGSWKFRDPDLLESVGEVPSGP
jgi:hypothetical protein